MFQDVDLATLEAELEAAQREVKELCENPRRKWTMTVPVREDDSDIVIAKALFHASQWVRQIRDAQQGTDAAPGVEAGDCPS